MSFHKSNEIHVQLIVKIQPPLRAFWGGTSVIMTAFCLEAPSFFITNKERKNKITRDL